MKCPVCSAEIPDDLIRKEGARLMAAARKNKAGGYSDPKLAERSGRKGGRAGQGESKQRDMAKHWETRRAKKT